MASTRVRVKGVNGSWFTIAGPGEGDEGVHLGTDVQGLYDAPVKTIRHSHAFQKGATYGGKRFLERPVVFGVVIDGTEQGNWEFLDSEWRKAWDYDKETELWVEKGDSVRVLRLKLSEQPDFQPEGDPEVTQIERVVMTTVADDPFWYSEDDTDEYVWESATGSTNVQGSVLVSNPTDQEIWAKFVCKGSAGSIFTLPDFSWGNDKEERAVLDAQRVIELDPLVAADGDLIVDSDEATQQYFTTGNTPYYIRMKAVRFLYPIPPYTPPTEVPVFVRSAGAGAGVQVRLPRPWSRPWGLH